MNLIDMILKALGSGNAINALSSSLGLTQDQTKRATAVAVPSLLAGLASLASTPQGAEQLATTVSRQDPSLADNLTGALAGQGMKLADQGSDLLGSLFGPGILSKLSGGLSRFTGIGEGPINKLLGMVFPFILSFLGKQQQSLNLGASGLANLLASQKDNLRAAMPAGLDNIISSVLPGLQSLFGSRPAAIDTDVNRPRADYDRPMSTGMAKSSPLRWAIPVALACVVLAAILFWVNRPRSVESVGAPGPVRQTGAGSESSITSFTRNATQVINNASGVFAEIKDAASAQAAVPRLKEVNTSLDGLRPVLNALPESARASAKDAIRPLVERVKQAAQAVLTIPGVADTVRPYIDPILATLNSLIS